MKKLFCLLSEKEINSNPDYQKVVKFSNNYNPKKDKSYRWVYEDSIHSFERMTDIVSVLDRKAESMIKYIAPITGLFGLSYAILVKSFDVCFWAGSITLVGIIFLLSSLISSLLSIFPQTQTFKPSTQDALKCADYPEYNSEQAMALFATSVDCSIFGKKILADLKAKYVRFAYGSFILGLILIFGGLFWIISSIV